MKKFKVYLSFDINDEDIIKAEEAANKIAESLTDQIRFDVTVREID